MILIYFSIVRKRISSGYKFYVLFLVSFIIFVLGRTVDHFVSISPNMLLLYIRLTVLFAIGAPSLLVGVTIQAGLKLSKKRLIIPYITGGLISLGYIITHGPLSWNLLRPLGLTRAVRLSFPIPITHATAHIIQSSGALFLLTFPCAYLLVRELRGKRRVPFMAFLLGIVIFGTSMV
ncbi:hypothetical protein BVY04_05070, partial [bacterium M21]